MRSNRCAVEFSATAAGRSFPDPAFISRAASRAVPEKIVELIDRGVAAVCLGASGIERRVELLLPGFFISFDLCV